MSQQCKIMKTSLGKRSNCWGPLCVVPETVAPREQALREACKSPPEHREWRWQARRDTNTEGSRGKSGLKNTLYPLKLALLCYSLLG